jgi:hypothetical protein
MAKHHQHKRVTGVRRTGCFVSGSMQTGSGEDDCIVVGYSGLQGSWNSIINIFKGNTGMMCGCHDAIHYLLSVYKILSVYNVKYMHGPSWFVRYSVEAYNYSLCQDDQSGYWMCHGWVKSLKYNWLHLIYPYYQQQKHYRFFDF